MSKISGPLAFAHTWARIVRPSGVLTESGVYSSPAANAGRSIVIDTAMRKAIAMALDRRVRRFFFRLMSTSSDVMVFDLPICAASHLHILGIGESHDRFMLSQPAAQLSCLSWKWRKRSSVKITERTHEEATEALHAGNLARDEYDLPTVTAATG